MRSSCSWSSSHLLLLQQDADGGQVFAAVLRLDLALQAQHPLVQVGAALREELRLVGVEQALSFGLGGGLQLLPHGLQHLQLLPHHHLRLWFLSNQQHPILQRDNASRAQTS